MADLGPHNSNFDEENDLRMLLQAYGSYLSLEAIASAYCQAKRNVGDACTILFEMYKNSVDDRQSIGTVDPSPDYNVKNETRTRAWHPKKGSISVGTVSSVLGKEYINFRPSRNGPCKKMRPLRVVTTPPIFVIQSEEPLDITTEGATMEEDIEKFLVDMLGDGFQLDVNTVNEVLGICGRDVNKPEVKPEQLDLCQRDLQNLKISSSLGAKELNSTGNGDAEYCLQREIVEALFTVKEMERELPKRKVVRPVRSRVFGKPVTGPILDPQDVHPIVTKKKDLQNEVGKADGDEEDNYDILRKNVKEYWETMKEYTKSAVEAFVTGDHARAAELMKEGNACRKMARDTDEESAQKIIESDKSAVMSLDLKGQVSKDVVRLLRSHLTSLSGIPSIEYLKVTCQGGSEGTKKKKSHRQLVKKVLEMESVGWSEVEEGVILVRVCDIDPCRLTFSKKES